MVVLSTESLLKRMSHGNAERFIKSKQHCLHNKTKAKTKNYENRFVRNHGNSRKFEKFEVFPGSSAQGSQSNTERPSRKVLAILLSLTLRKTEKLNIF